MPRVLSHELATIPPSIFDQKTGTMRVATSKIALKKSLEIDRQVSGRTTVPDAIGIDGCAYLWSVAWPKKGSTIKDFVEAFITLIKTDLRIADVYLIFDRYKEKSIKELLRLLRAGKLASRNHKLQLTSPLPPQQVLLSVTGNKRQLIDI